MSIGSIFPHKTTLAAAVVVVDTFCQPFHKLFHFFPFSIDPESEKFVPASNLKYYLSTQTEGNNVVALHLNTFLQDG